MCQISGVLSDWSEPELQRNLIYVCPIIHRKQRHKGLHAMKEQNKARNAAC